MKTLIICCFFITLALPVEVLAKRRKVFRRSFAFSVVNGYTFYSLDKKTDVYKPTDAGRLINGDAQMNPFFSSLEIARNFGRYEIGVRLQNTFTAFVSPFFKLNLNKNNSRASIIPAITVGVVPSQLLGGWLRASLGLSLNRYSSIEPFVGLYAWQKIQDTPEYEKNSVHFHAGMKINLFF